MQTSLQRSNPSLTTPVTNEQLKRVQSYEQV